MNRTAITILRKSAGTIITILIIAFTLALAFLAALEGDVSLLGRYTITVPDSVSDRDTYEFVYTLADENQHTQPFYFTMDADADTSSIVFSIYSFCQLTDELYYVCTYDYADGTVAQSYYIGYSKDFKEFAPHLVLGADLNFHARTADLYTKILSEIESEADLTLSFPIVYCYNCLFDFSGILVRLARGRAVSADVGRF